MKTMKINPREQKQQEETCKGKKRKPTKSSKQNTPPPPQKITQTPLDPPPSHHDIAGPASDTHKAVGEQRVPPLGDGSVYLLIESRVSLGEKRGRKEGRLLVSLWRWNILRRERSEDLVSGLGGWGLVL